MKLKPFIIGIFSLAIMGALLAYYLVPSPRETALIFQKARLFSKSLEIYQKLYDEGDRSAALMGPLIDLHLQFGDVDRSVEVMEEYLEKHPDELPALKKMGVLYQYSQKPDSYLKNLERIYNIEPNEEILKQLADIYNFYGMHDKQIKILEEMIEKYPPREKVYVDLCYLYIDQRNKPKTLETYERFIATKTQIEKPETVEFFISLLHDLDRKEEAIKLANEFVHRTNDAKFAVRIAGRLQMKGSFEAGLQLLLPFEATASDNPELLKAIVDLKIETGKGKEAYLQLREFYLQGRLPDNVLDSFVILALQFDNYDAHLKLAGEIDLKKLPPNILIEFGETAYYKKETKLVEKLHVRLGNEFIHSRPELETVLFLAEGKKVPADTLKKLQAIEMDTRMKMRMAKILLATGNTEPGKLIVSRFGAKDNFSEIDISELAKLFLDSGLAEQGRKIFVDMISQPGAEHLVHIQHGWAVLSTAAGHDQEVFDWINKETDPRILGDVFFQAFDKKYEALALKSARLFYQRSRSPSSEGMLARALLLNRKYSEALSFLRKLAAADSDYEHDYIAALGGTIKYGEPKDAAIAKNELVSYYDGHKKEMSDEQKLEMAYGLLDYGLKKEAEQIFFSLAQGKAPKSDEVQTVIYLWGPRPDKEQMSWLKKQALNSKGKDQAGWLGWLGDLGGTEIVIEMFDKKELNQNDIKIKDIYIQSLVNERKQAKLIAYLKQEGLTEVSTLRLGQLADLALGQEDDVLAFEILKRKNVLEPDRVTSGRLAVMIFEKDNLVEAKKFLTQHLSYGLSDYKKHFYYGEILWKDKEYGNAEKQYNIALNQYAKADEKTVTDELVKTQILARLGKEKEAINLYESLRIENPKNPYVQIGFSHLLMDEALLVEAEDVLKR